MFVGGSHVILTVPARCGGEVRDPTQYGCLGKGNGSGLLGLRGLGGFRVF